MLNEENTVDEYELDAYNWLCSLEINSEAEATCKELILCMLDEYKFNDYFKRERSKEAWKIEKK